MEKKYTFYTQSEHGELAYSVTATRDGKNIYFTDVRRNDGQLKDFRSYIDNKGNVTLTHLGNFVSPDAPIYKPLSEITKEMLL